MRTSLKESMQLLFVDEGGYSNRPSDSGGPTNMGITHRTLAAHRGVKSVTPTDVKNMTSAEASKIYESGYWTQSGGDLLPRGLDYAVFNAGVMSGPARAVRILQQILGVAQDGNVGPLTVTAAKTYPGGVVKLIHDYIDGYMSFLQSIKSQQTGFPVNGRGWTYRITGRDPKGQYRTKPGVLNNALMMADKVPIAIPEHDPTAAREDGGDAKAIPSPSNPWTKLEVAGPVVGTVLAGSAPFAQGPILWAIAIVIVAATLIGAYYAFNRIKRAQV